MSITDFNAAKKWNKLSKKTKQALLENVFCPSCGVTKIIDYTLCNDTNGFILKGKCSKCGENVSRFIENE